MCRKLCLMFPNVNWNFQLRYQTGWYNLGTKARGRSFSNKHACSSACIYCLVAADLKIKAWNERTKNIQKLKFLNANCNQTFYLHCKRSKQKQNYVISEPSYNQSVDIYLSLNSC